MPNGRDRQRPSQAKLYIRSQTVTLNTMSIGSQPFPPSPLWPDVHLLLLSRAPYLSPVSSLTAGPAGRLSLPRCCAYWSPGALKICILLLVDAVAGPRGPRLTVCPSHAATLNLIPIVASLCCVRVLKHHNGLCASCSSVNGLS